MTQCAAGVNVETLDPPAADKLYPSPTLPLKKQSSPEFELLLACVSPPNAAGIAKIRDLQTIVNWHEFLQTVRSHRLIPQVYSTFCSSEICDDVPTGIFEELRSLYYSNTRQSLRLTRDLIRVVKHFDCRGIPVLAYKGPALAALQENSDRQFSDIDLLVHPSDASKAKAALLELGYTTEKFSTALHEAAILKSGYECAFDLPGAKHSLELKWRIVPRFYSIDFDIPGFFDRSINVELNVHSIRTLCPEDKLLVLCVHAAKHAWSELSLLWDISKLIETQPINYAVVFRQAKQLGIETIVQTNLDLVQSLWGSPKCASREFFEEQSGDDFPFNIDLNDQSIDTQSIPYFLLMLSLRERWRDKTRFLARLIFTAGEGEWNSVRLPHFLSPLYGVVRIYRLGSRLPGIFASLSNSTSPRSP
jgi:hypothetical protein